MSTATQPTGPMVAEDLPIGIIRKLVPLVNSPTPANHELAKAMMQGFGLNGNEVIRGMWMCTEVSWCETRALDYTVGKALPQFSLHVTRYYHPDWVHAEIRHSCNVGGPGNNDVVEWSRLNGMGVNHQIKGLHRPTALQIYDAIRNQIAENYFFEP